ncbi:hypothetical protein GPJ56_004085 [Histomonas meleagridis]|uniref:uncharacterized protein n=1 Tax=Histomonas meleagridis TaxID=135588 RepID=UPI0035593DC1|nr:hypothetical protein GPJ56_004085 [Histomonas meleagridis]KAH0799482.1 hypothetical protein GO595_007737 [Histomonas meleagridis]
MVETLPSSQEPPQFIDSTTTNQNELSPNEFSDGAYNFKDFEEDEEESVDQQRTFILPSELTPQPIIRKHEPILISYDLLNDNFPFGDISSLSSFDPTQWYNFIPERFGLTSTLAYTYDPSNSKINIMLKRTNNFSVQNVPSFSYAIPNDEESILFSCNDGFRILENDMIFNISSKFKNAKKMIVDPLDEKRFFFLSSEDNNLYVFQMIQNNFHTIFVQANVYDFDVSKKYLLTVSSGKVSCIQRGDTSILPLWFLDYIEGSRVYLNDNYYFIFYQNEVRIYNITDTNLVQLIPNVLKVAKSGENIMFLIGDGRLLYNHFLFDFSEPIISVAIDDGVISAWSSIEEEPTILRFENKSKQNISKSDLISMKTLIYETTERFYQTITKMISKQDDKHEEMMKNTISMLNDSYKEVEALSIAMQTQLDLLKHEYMKQNEKLPLQAQIERYMKTGEIEKALEISCKLPNNQFLEFCAKDNTLETVVRRLPAAVILMLIKKMVITIKCDNGPYNIGVWISKLVLVLLGKKDETKSLKYELEDTISTIIAKNRFILNSDDKHRVDQWLVEELMNIANLLKNIVNDSH